MHLKTNISIITISKLPEFLPFDNTQKNLPNLINYIKTRINLPGQKIILHFNKISFILSANMSTYFYTYIMILFLLY